LIACAMPELSPKASKLDLSWPDLSRPSTSFALQEIRGCPPSPA
jgi:hypothetical protein